MTPRDELPTFGPDRIKAITDGLFTIVMTILVLEFPFTGLTGSGVLAQKLLEMWPHFNNYIMSFFFLGIFWILHHYQFHYIKRADGVMIWINILFLITVALLPFF